MSIFSSAARAVLDAVNTLAAVPVRYRRGEIELPIEAVPGATLATVTDSDGMQLRFRQGDWLIDAHWLDFGDGPERPSGGDYVIACDGTRWEVGKPTPGVPAWAWSDRERTRYRVHVREVAPDA